MLAFFNMKNDLANAFQLTLFKLCENLSIRCSNFQKPGGRESFLHHMMAVDLLIQGPLIKLIQFRSPEKDQITVLNGMGLLTIQ